MAELTSTTLHYLMAGDSYFWQWAEEGEVVVWRNGTTIVFRDELGEVLQAIAERGLPPLGALLLVLAACRDGWSTKNAEAGIMQGVGILAGGSPERDNNLGVTGVLEMLGTVAALPVELRRGVDAKATLLGLLFEGTHERFTRRESRQVIEALRYQQLDPALIEQIDPVPVLYRLTGDLRALREALRGLDTASLERRIRTSIDSLPRPADTAPDKAMGLLDQLGREHATSGLASLTRHLVAVLKLPHQRHQPGALPIDGFADITNRGSPDRLLLSELAMDDLTLTSRIANHEALYLRREAPPERRRPSRRILLDRGIRCWGTPRFLALAAALAVVHDDPAAEVLAHRDGSFQPIALATLADVQHALEHLDTTPHPGPALQCLLGQGHATGTDDLLITHEEVLHDPEFLAVWQALRQHRPSLLLTVGDTGELALYDVTPRGSHRRQGAKLDLVRLLGAPPASAPAEAETPLREHLLPMILSRKPFPLLLPAVLASGGEPAICLPELGIVGVTRDRRLLHWPPNTLRYAQQLLDTVPPADHYWVTMSASGQIAIVTSTDLNEREQETRLLVTDLTAEIRELFSLGVAQDAVRFVHRAHDWLLIFGSQSVQAIDPLTGRCKYRYIYRAGEEYWQGPLLKRGLETVLVMVRNHAICHAPVPDDFALGDLVHHYDPAHFSMLSRQAACLLPAVEGIGISTTGLMTVIQADDRRWSLRFAAHSLRWTLDATESVEQLSGYRQLSSVQAPPGVGYSLRRAVWEDGSAAYVDSRGLLHLVHADAGIPQVTIVLVTDQQAACWASDGTACGPSGYTGSTGVSVSAGEFQKTLSHFIAGVS